MLRSTWTIEQPIDDFGKMSKPLVKKYRRELKNLLGNLQIYLDALNAGAAPGKIQRGFIHPEPHGILVLGFREQTKHLTTITGNDGNSEEGREARNEQGEEDGV